MITLGVVFLPDGYAGATLAPLLGTMMCCGFRQGYVHSTSVEENWKIMKSKLTACGDSCADGNCSPSRISVSVLTSLPGCGPARLVHSECASLLDSEEGKYTCSLCQTPPQIEGAVDPRETVTQTAQEEEEVPEPEMPMELGKMGEATDPERLGRGGGVGLVT